MENRNDKEAFHYTYSAKEQEEIKNIRKKYAPAEEDQMTLLRRLDAGVYQKAATVALVVGIIGALLLGIGMCCTMGLARHAAHSRNRGRHHRHYYRLPRISAV